MYKHNLKFSFSNVFYLETFRKRTSRVIECICVSIHKLSQNNVGTTFNKKQMTNM